MNDIETTYLELEASFACWSDRLDALVRQVGDDDSQRRRIDELKVKQRLARSVLDTLRTANGKKWETAKVMVARAWTLVEASIDHFSRPEPPRPSSDGPAHAPISSAR